MPFLGIEDYCEVWHGLSLETLTMIQEEPIWRTMWGPYFGHKRAIFWPFLGRGNYGMHPELWNLAWSIPGHINYDSGRTNPRDHVRTMFWPKKGHISAIFRKRELWNTPRILIMIQEKTIWKTIWGPCFGHKGHILVIFTKGGYRINSAMWNWEWNIPGHND